MTHEEKIAVARKIGFVFGASLSYVLGMVVAFVMWFGTWWQGLASVVLLMSLWAWAIVRRS